MIDWIWGWERERKESRMIPRSLTWATRRCSCHLLYCFIELYVVFLMTAGKKAMSEIKGTVYWGGHGTLFPDWRVGRLFDWLKAIMIWRGSHSSTVVLVFSASPCHLPFTSGNVALVWLSLIVSSMCSMAHRCASLQVVKHKKVVSSAWARTRRLSGRRARRSW